jgi:hypothetical protein
MPSAIKKLNIAAVALNYGYHIKNKVNSGAFVGRYLAMFSI